MLDRKLVVLTLDFIVYKRTIHLPSMELRKHVKICDSSTTANVQFAG